MSAVRRRAVAVLAAAVLLPGWFGVGPAAAQSSELSDPPSFSTTTTDTTSTAPSATATTPTTTTTPEITAADTPKGILLDPADRVELASSLAEATEESGVCFGYEVRLGGSGASLQSEVLSNLGPDEAADGTTELGSLSETYRQADEAPGDAPGTTTVPSGGVQGLCPKGSLVLRVSLTYTSNSSEANDSASFSVQSGTTGVTGSTAIRRLRDLTGVDDGDLLGDQDDLALRNLAAALPLVLDDAQPAADTVTTASAQAPNGDRLTGSPGSDWIRAHGLGIGVAFGLLLLGALLILGGRSGRKRTDPPKGAGGLDGKPDNPFSTTNP